MESHLSGIQADSVSFGSGARVAMSANSSPTHPLPPSTSSSSSSSSSPPSFSTHSHQQATAKSPPEPWSSGQHNAGCVVVHNSNHIHVGSNLTLMHQPPRPVRRRPDVTPAVRALFRCPVESSDAQLLVTSRHIGAGWPDLARRLGFLGAETDEFAFKADSLREISYRMLLAWREKRASEATVENLAKALWDEEMYEALFRLAETPP